MTGPEFRAIRLELNLTLDAWGRALGYAGPAKNVAIRVSKLETGATITPQVDRLAQMYARHGIPAEFSC